MADSMPVSLFVTGRAQCPDCGAPLKIEGAQVLVQCSHCGGQASVQRRLRTLEATVEGIETASGPQEWKPAHQIDGQQQFEAHCPVCAALMQSDAYHQILRCAHCRTESKVERRLVREGPVGELALQELSRKWELQA